MFGLKWDEWLLLLAMVAGVIYGGLYIVDHVLPYYIGG